MKLAIHSMFKRILCGYATEFLSCSEEAAQFMFCGSIIREKRWIFVPNGIKTADFQFEDKKRSRMRMELGIEETFVLGNVGRLCSQKNQSFLLDIFKEIIKIEPKSVLLLVGDGEDREKLQRKADDLQITEKVIFYGVSTHIPELFSAMDVFVFPSLFEGLGIVAVEAQATGLPVVCSERVPKEAILLNTVSVVPLTQSASVWADAIFKYKNMKDERTQCAEKIKKKNFDIEHTVQIIKRVFR